MSLKVVKLRFKTPVHFGQMGIGIEEVSEVVHSDTLFGALCWAWASLYGRESLEDLLNSFTEKPPFLLSSCFIYSGDTFFLPKPHTSPPGFEDLATREEYSRIIKEMNYLPRETFRCWAWREKIDYGFIKSDYSKCYERFLVPRVALDRATSNSQIFYCGVVRYRDNCGLFCLIRIEDVACEEKLHAAFDLLGEMGLGGERTSGFGRFEPIWEDADEEWRRLLSFPGDSYCCLSLFHPENPEIIDELIEGASYSLLERRGWFSSPFSKKQYKRKTVTMFAEGSVFTRPITGHLVDVTPDIWRKEEEDPHPIYRYGYAFTIPIKQRE